MKKLISVIVVGLLCLGGCEERSDDFSVEDRNKLTEHKSMVAAALKQPERNLQENPLRYIDNVATVPETDKPHSGTVVIPPKVSSEELLIGVGLELLPFDPLGKVEERHLTCRGLYLKGKRSGVWVCTRVDGVRIETRYLHGGKFGKETRRMADGTQVTVRFGSYGRMLRKRARYIDTQGRKGDIKYRQKNRNGLLQQATIYDARKRKIQEIQYLSDSRSGPHIIYDQEGTRKKREYNFAWGNILNGTQRISEGNLTKELNFKMGIQHGLAKTYRSEGKELLLTEKCQWENGVKRECTKISYARRKNRFVDGNGKQLNPFYKAKECQYTNGVKGACKKPKRRY